MKLLLAASKINLSSVKKGQKVSLPLVMMVGKNDKGNKVDVKTDPAPAPSGREKEDNT